LCGCGETPGRGKFFVITHHRRAEARVIRERFGDIATFVVWAEGHDRCASDVVLTNTPKLLRDLDASGDIDLAHDLMRGVVANASAHAERPASDREPRLWVSFFHLNGFTYEGASADPPAQPVDVFWGAPDKYRIGMYGSALG
jgi:hypothetical protein